MLKAAADLTRDLNVARAGDLLGGPDRLGAARLCRRCSRRCSPARRCVAVAAGLVAILALYRAGSFIHELTHIKRTRCRGFRLVWNLIIGVPAAGAVLHVRRRPQPAPCQDLLRDGQRPEYLPLALMKPWTLPVFLIAAALAPVGMLIRFGMLAPLSLLSPKLRETVVAAIPGLQINPQFRRPRPRANFAATGWRWRPPAASGRSRCWRWSRPASSRSRAFLIFLGVASGVMFLNQVRTLVAHLWENDGEPMTRHRPISRQRQRAAAGDPAGAVGAGRPALSRAAPSAAGPALSCAGRGAPPAVRGAGRAAPSITRRAIAACRPGRPAGRRAAGKPARARRRSFHFDQADGCSRCPPSTTNVSRRRRGGSLLPFFAARRGPRRRSGRSHGPVVVLAGTGANAEARAASRSIARLVRSVSLNPHLRLPPLRIYSSERIRTVSPTSRNRRNGAQAARKRRVGADIAHREAEIVGDEISEAERHADQPRGAGPGPSGRGRRPRSRRATASAGSTAGRRSCATGRPRPRRSGGRPASSCAMRSLSVQKSSWSGSTLARVSCVGSTPSMPGRLGKPADDVHGRIVDPDILRAASAVLPGRRGRRATMRCEHAALAVVDRDALGMKVLARARRHAAPGSGRRRAAARRCSGCRFRAAPAR